MELKITVCKRWKQQMKDDYSKLEKKQIINQMRFLDYSLTLNLQEGFAGVATLEVQRGLDKNKEKNSERRSVCEDRF